MTSAIELTKFNKVSYSSSNKLLTAVDLFAGAGGFTLAAKKSNINVVAAVELNKHACWTYRENLVVDDQPKLYEEDILKIDPREVQKNHFPKGQECDLLLGGPPCQGFSVHRIKDSGVNDPRNNLLLQYFEFVKCLRPKVFLIENVPGLLWARHRPFLDALYKAGLAAGYRLKSPAVIDARDYGVPQRRKRVFILGVRGDLKADICWPPSPTHSDPQKKDGDKLKPWVTAASIFTKKVENDENNRHMNHSAELVEVFKNTPVNGSRGDSGRVLPCHITHNGHKDVYGRINVSEPGPTMTTACINPSKGRFVHPFENHGITMRHAARFQTFPENFIFKGGLIAGGAQIGNAVPVLLGEVLLKSISSYLLKDDGA